MKLAFAAAAAPDFSGVPVGTRRALWTMLRHACQVAALMHVVFLMLFANLGLPWLVWANVGSIALFVCSAELLLKHRNAIALSLVVGEVLLHAAAASVLLGWDSGFHYYLLTMVAPLVVGMRGTTTSKLVRLLIFGVLYAALDAWTWHVPPVYPLDPVVLDSIRYSNIAGMLAVMAFVALIYARLMTSAERALQTLARTDPLTGLHNRRHLLEIARAARIADAAALGQCVLLCDIDHFKHVNDHHGHEMGDLVLQRVAGAITAAVRAGDSVARWGGEEFVVLLPGADIASATQTAERIRCAVAALPQHGPCRPAPAPAADRRPLPVHVTITIGVAHIDPAETLDTAIARADEALYRGKAAGRNRVIADSAAASSVDPDPNCSVR